MLLINIISALFAYLGRLYAFDKVAFIAGAIYVVIGSAFIKIGRPLFWLIAIAYGTGLMLAEKSGTKLELAESFRRASRSLKHKEVSKTSTTATATASGTSDQKSDQKPEQKKEVSNETNETAHQTDVQQPNIQAHIEKGVEKVNMSIKKGVRFVGEFMSESEAMETSVFDVKKIESQLRSEIKGQDAAIDTVVVSMKRIAAKVNQKGMPLGVFLFLGPTGTGKTELVKSIAEATGRHLVRFDMPNYNSEAGVWELIGSPPGYVGSDKAGRLTGEIRTNPNAVLLLDEIEKAHAKMWDPFLRVFDEGKLKDQAQGFTVDLKNVLIFLTSNLLQQEEHCDDEKYLRNKLLNEGYFRPELVNRIDSIVMFKSLEPDVMKKIVEKLMGRLLDDFIENNNLDAEINVDRKVIEHIVNNLDTKFGVRDAKRDINSKIANKLADEFFEKRSEKIESIAVYLENEEVKVAIK